MQITTLEAMNKLGYSEGEPLPPFVPPGSEVKGLTHCQEDQVGLSGALKDVAAWRGYRGQGRRAGVVGVQSCVAPTHLFQF